MSKGKKGKCAELTDAQIEAAAEAQELNEQNEYIGQEKASEEHWFRDIVNAFGNWGYNRPGLIMREGEAQRIIDKKFGGKNPEKTKMNFVQAMIATLNKRPDLVDLFHQLSEDFIVQNTGSDPNAENYFFHTEKGRAPNLSALPLPMLSNLAGILEELQGMKSGSDLNIWSGWIGNMQLERQLPKTIAQKDPSGNLYRFVKELTRFQRKVNQVERVYFEGNKTSKRKNLPELFPRGDTGLLDLKTHALSIAHQAFDQQFEDREDFIIFVNKNLDMKINVDYKTGKVSEYNRWGPTGKKYPDGNERFGWLKRSSVPYMMYKGKQVKKGQPNYDKAEQLVISKKPHGKRFFKDMSQFQVLSQFMSAHGHLLQESGKDFVQWAENQQNTLTKILDAAENSLSDSQLDQLYEVADMIEQDIHEIHGLNTFQMIKTDPTKGQYYFPTKYLSVDRVRGLFKAHKSLEEQVEGIYLLWQAEQDYVEKQKLKDKYVKKLSMLGILSEKINILRNENVPKDGSYSDNPIFINSFAKHFRSISNLIDTDFRRYDSDVLTDYISETASQLKRRDVAIELLKLMINTLDNPKTMYNAMNLFKRSFGFSDAQASLLGIRYTDDSLANSLSKIGIPLNSNSFNRSLRIMSSYNIGNLLIGPADGLQNFSSSLQDMFQDGTREWFSAVHEYSSSPTKWEKEAEKYGVIVWVKFQEGFIEKEFRTGEISAYREHKKRLKKALKNINDEVDPIKAKKRLKEELAAVKDVFPGPVFRFFKRMADFAVTRKVDYLKDDSDLNVLVKIGATVYEKLVPSIQRTETILRTISYIIGKRKAQRLLRRHFTQEKEKDDLIGDMAASYVFITQFGLEQQNVGDFWGSTPGKLLGGLTIWKTQKVSWDFNTVRQLKNSFLKPEYMFTGKKWHKAYNHLQATGRAAAGLPIYGVSRIAELLLAMFGVSQVGRRHRAYRELSSMLPKGYSHMMVYGFGQMFYTLLFSNPATLSAGWLLWMRRGIQASARGTGGGWKYGMGFGTPLYALIYSSFMLLYGLMNDDDEDELYNTYQVGRNLTGVGGTDLVMTLVGLAKAMDQNVSSTERPDTYYTDPFSQVSYGKGIYGSTIKQVIKTGVDAADAAGEMGRLKDYKEENVPKDASSSSIGY